MKCKRAKQPSSWAQDLETVLPVSTRLNSVFSCLLGIVLSPSYSPKLWPSIVWRGIFGNKGASNCPVQRMAWQGSSVALVMPS